MVVLILGYALLFSAADYFSSLNLKTHNLFIFSTEEIPRILNNKMVQRGDLIS
jgi:hypothetical protein